MNPIRVGVVGLGQIAQIMHIPYLHGMPCFELAAICDISPMLVESIGNLYGVPARYTDPQELIEHAEIDAVVICTTFDHAPITLAAIEHGKHVLVEKPLCESPALAREVATSADQAGVKVMVAYMKRYDPGYWLWQEQTRELEGIQLVRVHDFCHNNLQVVKDAYDILFPDDIPQDLASSAAQQAGTLCREALGGEPDPALIDGYRLMLGLGVHDMTILRGSFGDPKEVLFTEVYVQDRPIVLSVLDYGDFRCMWEIGTTDTKHFDEELALWTRDAILQLRFPSPYLRNAPTEFSITRTEGEKTTTSRAVASYRESFHNELQHFYDCIVQDRRPLTDAWEGVRDLELLLEMVRHARIAETV